MYKHCATTVVKSPIKLKKTHVHFSSIISPQNLHLFLDNKSLSGVSVALTIKPGIMSLMVKR